MNVTIEDVENIRTPKSYQKSTLFNAEESIPEEEAPLSLEEIRKRFEMEQDIDDIEIGKKNPSIEPIAPETEEPPSEQENNLESEPITDDSEQSIDESDSTAEPIQTIEPALIKTEIEEKARLWNNMMELAETSVVMHKNYDGYKVYHSTILN